MMKQSLTRKALSVFTILGPLLLGSAEAAVVTQTTTDPNAGGIGYGWYIALGTVDTTTGSSVKFQDHVGAWSWEDSNLFAPGDPTRGWTHTSKWAALEILGPAGDPVVLTIRLDRQAGVPWPSPANPGRTASVASMFPSFTFWQGWDNDAPDNATNHIYQNREPALYPESFWAEDLTHVGYVDNTTESFAERSFNLVPGRYTLVMGSNAPADDTDRQGFLATLTTSIPEPGTVTLAGLATLGGLARRRRL